MSLSEYLEKHTNLQHLIWCEWLERQWNRPSRNDYYLMRIAQMVHRANSKRSLALSNLMIKFSRKGENDRPTMTREQATQIAKSRWLALVGKKPIIVQKHISEVEPLPAGLVDPED